MIVTRPERSGERTALRLKEMGHEPIARPLSRPFHMPAVAKEALSTHSGPVAITSAEAVRAIEQLGPCTRSVPLKPVFAVGKATAERARTAGLETVQTSEGNGVDLANLVPAISMVSGGAVFYLAGIPRAAGFETRLEKLHVPYRVAECYHMEEIPYEAGFLPRLFRETWPQAVLLYCRGTAEQFFRLVADVATGTGVLKDLRILCLGAAIAEVVPFAYRENVAIAAISKEDCLLTLFEEA